MSTETGALRAQPIAALLNDIFLLAMLAVIAGILTAAMGFQYLNGEIPCPLCLLQRVAMFAICFGIIQHFRNGFSYQNAGFSLLWAMVLLIISVRQSLLNIYPRPGHAWVGSAVFGIHMPVWSVIIATAVLLAYSINLCVLGSTQTLRHTASRPAALGRLADVIGLYVIALCLINLVSVILQCGLDACHTFGYVLLK